jgi:hypothetical protein
MAKTSRETASDVQQMDGFEGRYEDLGGYVAGFERFDVDMDPAPLFVGLPDDACQCPHWGVVLAGRLTFRYTDGSTEDITAGQAYYAKPGHTPVMLAGTELVEFSPAADIAQTLEVVMRNAAAATTA